MQLAQVIGHATSTIKHASLHGWRMLIVQPLDARKQPDGVPIIALDALGSGRGDYVVISSDGKAAREMTGADDSPARWSIIGVDDNVGQAASLPSRD
jgi:ethanolamine utilization protein EutN